MALVKARKTYGNTEIGGHATVQLGDKHTQNDIHLASVNTLQIFAINNELDLSQIVDAARRKRLRDTDEHDGRCSCPAKRARKEDFLMIGNDTTRKDYDHNMSLVPEALPTAQPIDKQEYLELDCVVSQLPDHDGLDENIEELPYTSKQAVVLAQDLQPILSQQTKSTLQEIYHLATARVSDKQPSTDQKLHFPKLLADFGKAMYTPLVKRVLQFHAPQQEFDVAPVKCHDTQLTTKTASGPLHDMAAAFVAILSFLACDHNGSNDSSKALISAQNGRKIPLTGALIAFAVARYLCFPQMARAISELSGDCLVLEDAFRVEQRIPMSHCENFSLLKALLTHRLAGSTAEAFLDATQFNLALGSRSGPLIHNNDWSVKGRITKKHRVVMAVYLKKSDIKCMDCQSDLVMKDTGEFFCYPCGRYFRNCASLSYLAAFAKKKQATRIPASALSLSQPTGGKEGSRPSPRIQEVEEEEEDSFDLDGLKNIDLRILPRRPVKRQPISVESEVESTNQASNLSGDWSETEVELFYDAVARAGLDFDQLAQLFGTKTPLTIHEYFTRLINSSREEFHKVADISNNHILGELKQSPPGNGSSNKRTPSTTHPYQMSETFAKRHHHCERIDSFNRGIWTWPGGKDHPTEPAIEMYLRCNHDGCRRIDWRTVHGLQYHIVKKHEQPKGTIRSLEKALAAYGVPVKEVEEAEERDGLGTGGTTQTFVPRDLWQMPITYEWDFVDNPHAPTTYSESTHQSYVEAHSQSPLQDYQMQLMLLEYQNKKRLMMARYKLESTGLG
ncbi:hypothetical protein LTR05_003903 [Lithohypha guttulata]|uniref:Myb-like domain-containing protein n=1 Tax=Lithohypha guttulata TaxID=1690604 RepID=A0AAN7T0Y1_9EURO|nr:hypothetical protein LTR05_003903 [Lithohypha guttulata]